MNIVILMVLYVRRVKRPLLGVEEDWKRRSSKPPHLPTFRQIAHRSFNSIVSQPLFSYYTSYDSATVSRAPSEWFMLTTNATIRNIQGHHPWIFIGLPSIVPLIFTLKNLGYYWTMSLLGVVLRDLHLCEMCIERIPPYRQIQRLCKVSNPNPCLHFFSYQWPFLRWTLEYFPPNSTPVI